jgi:hypothetical protein
MMGMIKRIFPLMMTTNLERRFSLEKPREGKMAFKPLQLFNVVCSKLYYYVRLVCLMLIQPHKWGHGLQS